LRITAKRARYGAELAATGRSNKQLERYLEALKNLQDVVGEHQDAVVAEETLRKLARKQTGIAAGRLIACERVRRVEQRRLYPDALAAVLRRGTKALG
jgi:CHAD domain-containing protein